MSALAVRQAEREARELAELQERVCNSAMTEHVEGHPGLRKALDTLARHWGARAEVEETSGRKGCKGRAADLRTASVLLWGAVFSLQQYVDQLAAEPPAPAREPVEVDDMPAVSTRPTLDQLDQLTTDAAEHADARRSAMGDGAGFTPARAREVRETSTADYLAGVTNDLPGAAVVAPFGHLDFEPTETVDLLDQLKMPTPVGVPPLAQRPEAMMTSPFADPLPTAHRPAYAGRRVTFADLAVPVPGDARPGHRSHSQLETFSDCGVKYRLQRYENVEQVPSWALVGGNAYHAAIAEIETTILADGEGAERRFQGAEFWVHHLNAEVAATFIASPSVDMASWHAANGGKEGFDWWRVEGEAMASRYLAWRPAFAEARQILILPDGRPAIEVPFVLNVDGVELHGVIDQVWTDAATGGLLVVDLKSGRSAPSETFQLGEYGWALRALVGEAKIQGAYTLARKPVGQQLTTPIDVLTRHPWDELVYRVHTMDAAERAGVYVPRVSSFCGSCSVAPACPVRNAGHNGFSA